MTQNESMADDLMTRICLELIRPAGKHCGIIGSDDVADGLAAIS